MLICSAPAVPKKTLCSLHHLAAPPFSSPPPACPPDVFDLALADCSRGRRKICEK